MWATGLSQRLVLAGGRRELVRMDRASCERSLVFEYIPPALKKVSRYDRSLRV